MTTLVTGGGGFVGRAIVDRLLRQGERVRVVGRRRYPDLERVGVDTIQGDIADAGVLKRACSGVQTVHHTAACVELWHPPAVVRRTNVEGTSRLIDAAAEAGVQRIVFTSSASVVFGESDLEGVDESVPYPKHFTNLYAETKAAAEQMILEANGRRGLRTIAIRPHLVWGPRDTHLIPNLIARARAGSLIQVGDGRNRMDITYVDNVAEAHERAAARLGDAEVAGAEVGGRAYFIGQREPVVAWAFFGDLLRRLGYAPPARAISYGRAYAVGAACELVWKATRRRGVPPMTRFLAAQMAKSHYFDQSAARRLLGYEASVSTADGVERVVAAFRPGAAAGAVA
jgi:nucleoside-diphosphate-sugar epimerase